jgi:hypothetical protein
MPAMAASHRKGRASGHNLSTVTRSPVALLTSRRARCASLRLSGVDDTGFRINVADMARSLEIRSILLSHLPGDTEPATVTFHEKMSGRTGQNVFPKGRRHCPRITGPKGAMFVPEFPRKSSTSTRHARAGLGRFSTDRVRPLPNSQRQTEVGDRGRTNCGPSYESARLLPLRSLLTTERSRYGLRITIRKGQCRCQNSGGRGSMSIVLKHSFPSSHHGIPRLARRSPVKPATRVSFHSIWQNGVAFLSLAVIVAIVIYRVSIM